MKVPDIHSVVHGLDPTRQGRSTHIPSPSAPRDTKNADGDRLDVSLSARISGISKEVAESLSAHEGELSAARQEEILVRIRSGFYNTEDLLDDTGQRILDFYSSE